MLRKKQKGFTLIELLIVVAIIAIIAAIPNLLTALQKGRQKRTMGDMKTIANGLESYDVDNGFYPQTGTIVSDLKQYLEPFHIQKLPLRDGWNNDFRYAVSSTYDVYSVRSYGRNRTEDAPSATETYYVVNTLSDFDKDIIICNGQFTWAPKQ